MARITIQYCAYCGTFFSTTSKEHKFTGLKQEEVGHRVSQLKEEGHAVNVQQKDRKKTCCPKCDGAGELVDVGSTRPAPRQRTVLDEDATGTWGEVVRWSESS